MIENYKGKFLLLTASGSVTVLDNSSYQLFDVDLFNAFVHRTLDCDIYERVFCPILRKFNISMLVDESGLLKGKPINVNAWCLYSGMNPMAPIVGDVLFCTECYQDYGEGFPESDFCFLSDDQLQFLLQLLVR